MATPTNTSAFNFNNFSLFDNNNVGTSTKEGLVDTSKWLNYKDSNPGVVTTSKDGFVNISDFASPISSVTDYFNTSSFTPPKLPKFLNTPPPMSEQDHFNAQSGRSTEELLNSLGTPDAGFADPSVSKLQVGLGGGGGTTQDSSILSSLGEKLGQEGFGANVANLTSAFGALASLPMQFKIAEQQLKGLEQNNQTARENQAQVRTMRQNLAPKTSALV